ncbi:hypothetical protein [Pelagovum pacificum]|uniref:Uncharacterized protein n=1 Tax=Pelagovum pacificum TaxID=2588711 RepID=A0A5C5GHH3_9RHOB|nr:hypothetical protein [Pelagovum pacificum]QQA42624.1 hypothetical protein I8N54_17890 [Pelagovum pacificum]TNY34225.1 hypothetical protein FHY64_13500 [Pelagovum pacificum]
MSDIILTKTRLNEGVWEGFLTGYTGDTPPRIQATHDGKELEGVEVSKAEGGHAVRLPIPASIIADGVHTVVLTERESGDRLATVSIVAGDALADDIRAEVDLLRAELDMLKRAFRRHCTETV